ADSKIKRYLKIREAGFAPWLFSSGTFKKDDLETDQQIVSQVFLEEGYLDVRGDAPKVYLSPDKRYIFIHYDINEGQQYTLGKIGVTGDFVEDEGLTESAALQIVGGRKPADIQEEQWRAAEHKPKRWPDFELKGPSLQTGTTFKFSTMHEVRGNIEQFYQDQGY